MVVLQVFLNRDCFISDSTALTNFTPLFASRKIIKAIYVVKKYGDRNFIYLLPL